MGLAPHRKGPQVTKKRILLLGPKLKAVSGVATHLNQVFGSSLANDFELIHFQVGREGKSEGKLALILRFVASPISLAWTLLSERPQIVHLNTSFDRKAFWRDLVYLFVARFFGKKIVYQVHGGDLPRVLFNNDPGKTKWVERALRKTDVVCLLSSEEMRAYSEFVPGVRLELIPNAIDMDPKVVVPSEPKTGPLRLVFVGRLAPAKGVAECVGALKLLVDEGRAMRLTVAGLGPQEEELKVLVASIDIGEHVDFVGPIFDEEENKLWRESDVFVFPTYHHEGLPYALLESMAAGCVPTTTRVGGHPDVMEHNVHGLFVPPRNSRALADAVIKLDEDRNLLLKMAQNGISRIREHYDVERLAEQFRNVYNSLA
jgi:glycosyltransferase involved in cell wall biosynthesis